MPIPTLGTIWQYRKQPTATIMNTKKILSMKSGQNCVKLATGPSLINKS